MSAAPVANLIGEEIRPGPSYSSPDSLMDYVRSDTTVAYHPAGTCRMGVDDTAASRPT
jgi:choline dehydrogenase